MIIEVVPAFNDDLDGEERFFVSATAKLLIAPPEAEGTIGVNTTADDFFVFGDSSGFFVDASRYSPSRTSLYNRPYVPGCTDCSSLVRDYFLQQSDRWYDLPPDYSRNLRLINDAVRFIEWLGFSTVPVGSPYREGDVLMFFGDRGRRTVHTCVYVGGGEVLAHMPFGVSRSYRLSFFSGASFFRAYRGL